MSYCELCGRQTPPDAEKKRVVVDGTVFSVCVACSRHGKPYAPGMPVQTKKSPQRRPASRPKPAGSKKITMTDETMLAPDFARLVREARTRKGLTHEQLGMQMNEKAALLKKIETGALKPDELFAKKLGRHLGVKLYVSVATGSSDSDDEQ